jgi:hypothetical protein
MDGLTVISYRMCTTPALACKQTDKARESETKSNEEPARPVQVVILAPLGAGLRGIDRVMDKTRRATQNDRFANIKRHLYPVRRLQRLIVKPADIEGRASTFGRLIEDPDLRRRVGENGKASTSNAVKH